MGKRSYIEVLEGRTLLSAAVMPVAAPVGSAKLAGALIGTAGSYRNQGNTIAKAMDGNTTTYFDSPTSTGWVGLDLGSPTVITQMQYVPRPGYASRMTGGLFQGSNTSDFSSSVTTLASIASAPASGKYTALAISNNSAFRYVRYLGASGSAGNVAELEFDGAAIVTNPSLPANTAVATANSATDVTIAWASDYQSTATSFTILRLGPTDLNPVAIGTAPAGAASYDDSSATASTAYTYQVIPTTNGNPDDDLITPAVTTPATVVVTPASVKLTGRLIGSASSYRNVGNTIANAFDGNLNTYFDGPVGNGMWVGSDFGSPNAITQIKYAPRNGYASRMIGGVFQVSNTADFSAGVVTVATITTLPASGLRTINVTTNGGYRYARYLSPNSGCGNIAELEFDGISSQVTDTDTTPAPLPAFPTGISWTNGAPSPIVRAEAEGGSVNGVLYVFGGFNNDGSDLTYIPLQSECDSYNPVTNSWTRLKDFPEPFTHAQEVIVGTIIWFMGGYIGNHPGPGTTHVWVYDTTNDSWSRGPDLPEARGAGAAALVGNTIYFAGGMDKTRTIDEDTTYALDLTNQAAGWTQLADVPNGRNHVAAASLGGYFYLIGGQHGQEGYQAAQSEVDRYDPATDTWTKMASIPSNAGKSHITSGTLVYDGRIIVVGGETGYDDPQRYVMDYDPATNTWNQLALLPGARSTVVASIINGQLVVTTGNSPSATNKTWIGSFTY